MAEKVKVTLAQVFYRSGGWRFRTKSANGVIIVRDTDNGDDGYSRQIDARAAAEASVPAGTPIHITAKSGGKIKVVVAGETDDETDVDKAVEDGEDAVSIGEGDVADVSDVLG